MESASFPATYGPAACPKPWKAVKKPYAAGAMSGPTISPQTTAMMAGIPQAVRPNSTADVTTPAVPVDKAKIEQMARAATEAGHVDPNDDGR